VQYFKDKVGVIALSMPRERVDLAEKFHINVISSLENAGFEVYTHKNLIFETDQCIKISNEIKQKGVSSILFILGTWVDSPVLIDTLKGIDVPFGIWAEDNPESFSLTAGGIIHGTLDELGINHHFFYGSPNCQSLLDKITIFIKAASCSKNIKDQKLCVVGGRVPGMYTTMADIIQVKKVFGIEIVHIDSLRVYLEAIKIKNKKIKSLKQEIVSQFGKVNVNEQCFDKSLRLYFALKKILSEEKIKIAAVKCMDEMINNYAPFCLANSFLNDDGYTISCEGDIYGAITMQILKEISSNITLFGDVNHINQKENILRIVNCGSMPTKMAETKKEIDLLPQYEYISSIGGATTVFSVKDSPATIARLFRKDGVFGIIAFEGETFKQPKVKFKEARENWPHAFVKFKGESDILIQNLRSNHLHLTFGWYLNVIKEFCKLNNINFVTIKN